MVRILRAWWPIVALAGVACLAGALVLHYGATSHEFQPDEFDTVIVGRRFADAFFQTLFSVSPAGRGPERLCAVVFALPTALFNDTAVVFRSAHVLFGLLYLSAALPIYALARGLGLERWQAIFPAAAAMLTPWLLFGATMLNVTLAYPAAMALAWASWRSMVSPSLRTDAVLLAIVVLGAMAREGNALFGVAAAVAVIVGVWRDRPAGKPLGASLRAYPGRLVRAHPLLVSAAGALLLAVLIFGLHRLLGSAYQREYSGTTLAMLEHILGNTWRATAELTMGTGYLPMVIALPWLAHELLRPRSRGTGAFAVVAVAMFVTFIAMVAYYGATTNGAPDDERYVAVLAGLPPLIAAVALFKREVHPLAVAVSGLLLARVVVTQGLHPVTGAYDYFLAPARVFFTVVIQGQLSTRLPFSDQHIATTLMLIVLAGQSRRPCSCAIPSPRGWCGPRAPRSRLGLPILISAAGGITTPNTSRSSPRSRR